MLLRKEVRSQGSLPSRHSPAGPHSSQRSLLPPCWRLALPSRGSLASAPPACFRDRTLASPRHSLSIGLSDFRQASRAAPEATIRSNILAEQVGSRGVRTHARLPEPPGRQAGFAGCDPDRWIASGRDLKHFRPPTGLKAELFYSNHPALCEQVKRWWFMVATVSIRRAEFDDVGRLTEEDMREMWQAVKRMTIR